MESRWVFGTACLSTFKIFCVQFPPDKAVLQVLVKKSKGQQKNMYTVRDLSNSALSNHTTFS
jgi:hypothetical protein